MRWLLCLIKVVVTVLGYVVATVSTSWSICILRCMGSAIDYVVTTVSVE